MSMKRDIEDAIATQRQIIADLQEYGPASLMRWPNRITGQAEWTELGKAFDEHAALVSALEDQARRRGMVK